MGWSRIFKGEPMPDKNDPKYRETYERQKAAGEKFADCIGISWCAKHINNYANAHKKTFLVFSFGIVIILFLMNIARMVRVAISQDDRQPPVEVVDKIIQKSRDMKSQRSE